MSNRGLRTVLAAGFLACAIGCGGKGETSAPDPDPVVLRVDQESLALTSEQGVAREATLVVTAPGAPDLVAVRATIDGSALELVETSARESYALVILRARATLAPGTYEGTVTIVACADDACARQVGEPLRVPYGVTVLRPLASPNPVRLTAVSGATAEAAVAVTLPPRATGFDVAVSAGASWLTIVDRTALGFRVRAAARPRGTYRGALRFTAGDEVRVVQVIYEVAPRTMVVTPNPVVLAATSGAAARAAVRVALPDDASDFEVDAQATGGWLTAEDRTAAGVALVARSLPQGQHLGSATFRAGDSTVVVPVVYEVSAPPGGEHGILAAPARLTFTATEGAPSAVQLLQVTPPSWGSTLQARVEYGAAQGWLTSTPRSGGFDVQADAGALVQGSYTATLRLSGDAWTEDVHVPVTLTVAPGLVRPPDRTVTVTVSSAPADLLGSVPVQVVAGPARTFTATSDAAWLVLDDTSGVTGDALRYHLELAHIVAMAPGAADVATVTISAQPAFTPTSFRVRLVKEVSDLVRVTPYAQPAGRANRVLVRGRGFDVLGAGPVPVTIDGIGAVEATRRSDEELELIVPAAPPGSYTVRLASALDLPTSEATLRLFAPGALPAAWLAQSGTKRGLRYDPVRQAIYFVNLDQHTVVRYARSGATWIQSQRSIAALEDLGASPDGETLFAATLAGSLHLIDPDTLADREVFQNPLRPTFGAGLLPGASNTAGLPVTNDGRLWLGAGEGGNSDFGTLGYFDLAARSFFFWPYGDGSCFRGPVFSMSRDGERLLIAQCGYFSIEQPIIVRDAVDGVLRQSPSNDDFYLGASHSDSGDRVILDHRSVYDREHALVGGVSPPSGYEAWASVLSPDGTRAYVFAQIRDTFSYRFPSPGIYVFDTREVPTSGPALPLLGSFDLDESFAWVGRMTIAPDGRTLILASGSGLMVVPIPEPLTQGP